LELPHILVLIDDPDQTVIEPLFNNPKDLRQVYDFDLMLGSGHLKGYLTNDSDVQTGFMQSLESLTKPELFTKKYDLKEDKPILLFAIGDGNHSLATAKAIWEKRKQDYGMEHPARYALVEVENIHDKGLEFEPIHRVLFSVKGILTDRLKKYFGSRITIKAVAEQSELVKIVEGQTQGSQKFGLISEAGFSVAQILNPAHTLTVGSLQPFLDQFLESNTAERIDYVHGEKIVCDLGRKPGNAGFFLPAMRKADLFQTVITDGVLPRKTFSMGEAKEKRFYMESRKIVK
jgi:hypothetical protein